MERQRVGCGHPSPRRSPAGADVAESLKNALQHTPMGLIDILFELIRAILGLAITVLVIYVVIGWLFAFDIISRSNRFVFTIYDFTRRCWTDFQGRPTSDFKTAVA